MSEVIGAITLNHGPCLPGRTGVRISFCALEGLRAWAELDQVGAVTLQISRRYHIHPQVNVLTKHV